MTKREIVIRIIAFILVFLTMLITLPIKRYYNSDISINRTENVKTIKYGRQITVSNCNDNNFTLFETYKKDIISNGKLDFYGYDVITGEINNQKIYCVRDGLKHKTMIITYKDKKLLKTGILNLLDKNILILTEYQYYRLNRFLFGYKRPEFSIIGTVSNIDR